MPRGGARPGAGRPKGIPNTRQRAKIVKDLVERGEDPLSYFLGIMKDPNESKQRRDWAASQAAPYCHARMASIDQTVNGNTKQVIEIVRFSDQAAGELVDTAPVPDAPLALSGTGREASH